MQYVYTTHGTCSKQIIIDVNEETNRINTVKFIGGCPGNTIGVSKLVQGRYIDDVIEMLDGVPCGTKGTSCPDQLATALKEIRQNHM